MANEQTVARATIELGADGSSLSPQMAAAVAKAQAILDGANKKAAAAAARSAGSIQKEIDKINAARPNREIGLLEAAVRRLGGVSALSGDQLSRVTAEVNRLAAAGAKVPASLQGLTGETSKLGAAFTSLTTGGGVSGALAALGPAGVAAAAGIGAASLAATKIAGELKDLAGQAEQWTNISTTTGLGVEVVQQLTATLEDAGISGDTLAVAMKSLHREIAEGGKDLSKYGISLAEIRDLSPEQQLQAVAQAIMNISDVNERAAAAQAAFGKGGEALIPVLNTIAESGYKVVDALGEKQIQSLTHLDAELDKAARSWTAFKNELLAGGASIINWLDDFEDRWTMVGGQMGRIRNPVTESLQDFEARMARIKPDESPLTLTPETPAQKAAVAAYEAAQKKIEEASKKAAEEMKRTAEAHKALVAQLSGTNAQAELEKLGAAFNELGVEGVADLEALRKKLEQLEKQGAKITDKGLLGVLRGGKIEIPEMGKLDLGLAAEEMPAVLTVAQEKFDEIAIAAARAGLSTREIDDALKAAGASGGQLEVALSQIPVTFGSVFKDTVAQLPQVILGAIQGGGDVGRSIGSFFGGQFLSGLTGEKGPLGKANLTKLLGSTFGGALSAILPGLGSILGAGLGGLFDKIGGLFGNKTIMKVNDMRDAFLASQGGWLKLQQTLAQVTDEDLVKQVFDAKTVDEFNAAVAAVEEALAKLGDGVTIPISYEVTGSPSEQSIPLPEIASGEVPEFARGGIVSRPTIAKIGEVPEAIIPLDRLSAGLDMPRQGRTGRRGAAITINQTIAENPFQTAEGQLRLRQHTLEVVERRMARNLAALVAAGEA